MEEIKKDEYELLRFFVSNEIKTYKKQLNWYEGFEPESKEKIKYNIIYTKRLRLLESKLNAAMNSSTSTLEKKK